MSEGINNMEVQDTKNQTVGNANNVAGVVSAPVAVTSSEKGKFTKVIKRYQNRKLYDTHQSCYVTLDEIADMIVRGEEVMVIDNRTKKDITSSTLTQIIFEKQKRSKTVIPVLTLRDIIQVGGGTFSGFLAKTSESGNSILSKAKADLERSFSVTENLRGAFQVTQRSAEDLKKAINDRVASSSGKGADALNAAQAQLQNLSNQLVNIEKLIDAAEARNSGNA
jgi:polyhydroxyalkanoate synthesis repressor PhaR